MEETKAQRREKGSDNTYLVDLLNFSTWFEASAVEAKRLEASLGERPRDVVREGRVHPGRHIQYRLNKTSDSSENAFIYSPRGLRDASIAKTRCWFVERTALG